jgi:hypothetical protein
VNGIGVGSCSSAACRTEGCLTTAARSELLPDLPTVGDFVPGYEASTQNSETLRKPTELRDRSLFS